MMIPRFRLIVSSAQDPGHLLHDISGSAKGSGDALQYAEHVGMQCSNDVII